MPSGPTPSPESSWNPLVISLVIAICIIFVLFSYYEILRQLCCAINALIFSRHQDRRQLLNEANVDDSSLQYYSRGLESSIIHSLPITQFRKKNGQELNPNNTECAVCLAEFEEGEWLKHLPNCRHAFHISCIDTWFQSHSNCPLCRSNVYDLSIPRECSVAMYRLLENLRREDYYQERATHNEILRTAVLQNPALIYESTGTH